MTRLGFSSVGRRTLLCKPTSEKSRKRVCGRRRRKGPSLSLFWPLLPGNCTFPFPPPPSFCSWHHWLFQLAAASSVLLFFPSSFPFCHLILRIGGRGSFLGIVDSSSPSVDDTVGLYSSPPERPPPPPPPCSVGCLSRLRLRPPLLLSLRLWFQKSNSVGRGRKRRREGRGSHTYTKANTAAAILHPLIQIPLFPPF